MHELVHIWSCYDAVAILTMELLMLMLLLGEVCELQTRA